MTEIRINETKRTIEVTKAFAKEASKFGTDKYKMLKEARCDFPTFKVITKSAPKRKNSFKGLTLTYMEEYIKAHDDKENTIIVKFYEHCGKDQNGEIKKASTVASYGTIKKWFLETYPQFENYNGRKITINKVNENKIA